MAHFTKIAMKETKAEREAREKEEVEGTPPPTLLPIGAGQLDKALPATRLLEKRRLLHLVNEELERQKVVYAQYVEHLQSCDFKYLCTCSRSKWNILKIISKINIYFSNLYCIIEF
jgi:hypothetical protein